MKTSELLNYYLTTLHSLQDYLVGFALLQTVTFLYGLKTFGSLIYPHKNLIMIAIVVVSIFNWIVLATTTVFEVSITDLIASPKDNLYLNLKPTIYRAFLLRGALITLINLTSAGLFYLVARHNLKAKIIIN